MTKASRYKLARNLGKTDFKPTPVVSIERPQIKPLASLIKAVIAGQSLAYRQLADMQREQAEAAQQIGAEGDQP